MSFQDRRPKSYYVDYTRQKRFPNSNRRVHGSGSLTNNARFKEVPDFGQGGRRGFLITSVDEVKSYLEMRNVLEGYFHELYDKQAEQDGDRRQNQSLEDELESELKNLRVSRPFKQVRTYCKNAIFLNIVDKFDYVDPVLLVDKFFDEMAEKRTNRTSNTFKVLPVFDSFRNNVASAKEAITKLLSKKFLDDSESKNYFIEFQSRGNYKLESEDKQRMVAGVAEAVSSSRPNWRVSRENVDYMIVLVALRDICCLSVVEKYFQRAKYNVIEFGKDFHKPDKKNSISEDEQKECDEVRTTRTSSSDERQST